MRLACLMWYDVGIAEYADINYKINKMYCDAHGYDLLRSSKRCLEGRSAHWEKLPMILDAITLGTYDYVIWIDSDAHFYVDSAPIENVIKDYPDVSLILSGDLKQQHPWEINSGFMIIRCDETSKFLLNNWAHNRAIRNIKKFPYYDQSILWTMYEGNIGFIREASVVIPYGILQHFYEAELAGFSYNKYTLKNRPYIQHSAGLLRSDRIKISSAYLLSLSRIGSQTHRVHS